MVLQLFLLQQFIRIIAQQLCYMSACHLTVLRRDVSTYGVTLDCFVRNIYISSTPPFDHPLPSPHAPPTLFPTFFHANREGLRSRGTGRGGARQVRKPSSVCRRHRARSFLRKGSAGRGEGRAFHHQGGVAAGTGACVRLFERGGSALFSRSIFFKCCAYFSKLGISLLVRQRHRHLRSCLCPKRGYVPDICSSFEYKQTFSCAPKARLSRNQCPHIRRKPHFGGRDALVVQPSSSYRGWHTVCCTYKRNATGRNSDDLVFALPPNLRCSVNISHDDASVGATYIELTCAFSLP